MYSAEVVSPSSSDSPPNTEPKDLGRLVIKETVVCDAADIEDYPDYVTVDHSRSTVGGKGANGRELQLSHMLSTKVRGCCSVAATMRVLQAPACSMSVLSTGRVV